MSVLDITDDQILQLTKECFPFAHMYDNQLELITQICRSFMSGNKFFILEAAPGIGKSVIAYTVGKVLERIFDRGNGFKTTVLTKTRNLQTQYSKSFKGIESLWGRANYLCAEYPQGSVRYGDPECGQFSCRSYRDCEYVNALNRFDNASLRVTNYAYFLTKETIETDFLVLDEAHNLEELLCERYSVVIGTEELQALINYLLKIGVEEEDILEFKNECTKVIKYAASGDRHLDVTFREFFSRIADFLSKATFTVGNLIEIARESQDIDAEKTAIFYSSIIIKMLEPIGVAMSSTTTDYVQIIEQNEDKKLALTAKLKPLHTSSLAKFLFLRSPRILLMSATIGGIKDYAEDLGIKKYGSADVPSPFPTNNRLIAFLNLPKLSRNNFDELLRQYVSCIDDILDRHADVRGVIHTVSYKNAESIIELSSRAHRMYCPPAGEILDLAKLIKEKNGVIVSPAVTEGIDLKDDLSRFQIIFKVPYPSLGDPWIKEKLDRDFKWYQRKTAVTLVQSYGRSNRHVNDTSITYVLDGSFSRFLNGNRLPKYVKDAVIEM